MLFFRKKKKKKQAENAPVWFMWLMGGFVVYALITNLFTDNVSKVQKEAAQPEVPDSEYFNFPIVRDASRPLFSRDITVGQGATAECWYSVSIDYKLYNSQGELVETTQSGEPVNFAIGRAQVPLALERGALGMQAGGKRAITAHPSLLFGEGRSLQPKMQKGQFGGYIITMRGIERPVNLPFSDLGLRIYDDASGEGKLAQCTDRVRLKLRGWNTNGQALWEDKNLPAIMVNIGAGEAPYAIERGLIGMRVGGKRTLIVPPGYMEPLFPATEDAAENGMNQAATPEQDKPSQEKPEESAFKRAVKELEAKLEDNFLWQDLPVPANSVIILELELLPEEVKLPNTDTKF